jgi:hypothetical protein
MRTFLRKLDWLTQRERREADLRAEKVQQLSLEIVPTCVVRRLEHLDNPASGDIVEFGIRLAN